jgi:CheY-like chemotaxis protein/curved DNA-binding protein CbpA
MTAVLDLRRPERWSTDLARLLERTERSETHYDVLGLSQTADSSAVSEAYSRIVDIIQPAREALKPSQSGPLDIEIAAIKRSMATRLDSAFGRVTLAYSVLSDPKRKSEYDECLRRVEPAACKDPMEASGDSSAGGHSNAGHRASRRQNLYIAAQVTGYSRDGARWQEPAETLDVSKTELTFRIRRTLQPGQILHISLPLPTHLRAHGFDNPNYEVYATVCRVEPARKGVRVAGVELIGEQPPAAYIEKPWARLRNKSWDGAERRRKPRHHRDEVIWVEYFTELMRSVRREAGRTENVSEGGMRIKIKSAPLDFEYMRISYPDGRPPVFATVCDTFVGEDSFERLCVRFLRDDELSLQTDALAQGANEPKAFALGDGYGIGEPASVPPTAGPLTSAEKPAKVEMLRAPNFRRRRILIADDDDRLRNTLGKILDNAGYEVMMAEDGKAAVAKAASEHPDLVITDALMPKLHGFLVCKTIKGFSPPPKVIMLTAVYTKPAYRWEAREKYGADELMTKPFNVSELLAVIEKHLGQAVAAAEQVSA